MIRLASVFFVAGCALLVNVAAAGAADPSKIGENVEKVVSPNAESFWKVAVIVGILVGLFTRKYNVLGVFLVLAAIAGAIIYKPDGFADLVTEFGDAIL